MKTVTIPVAFMPLVDSAPLIISQEMGFAEAEGVALDLIAAPSWSSVRDMLAFGRVDAAQTVDLSFEVAGPLARLDVKEGQSVKSGELVAALDPKDFQLALREAEVQLKLARQDLLRKQKLIKDRGISQSLVDDAQAHIVAFHHRIIAAYRRSQAAMLSAIPSLKRTP